MRDPDEVQSLLRAVLARVSEGEAVARYEWEHITATRFGDNAITQNTSSICETVEVDVRIGRRQGSASTTRIDASGLDDLVRSASEIAALSPEDPESMPLPGPQDYWETPSLRGNGHDEAVAADGVARVVDRAKSRGYAASGVFKATTNVSGIANTGDLYGVDHSNEIDWSTTVHGPSGSGKAAKNCLDIERLDPEVLAQDAVDRAEAAQDPIGLAPGNYDVILAPPAAAQLVEFIGYMLAAREATEGSSPFTGTVGTQHLAEAVTLSLAADDPELPLPKWGTDGLAVRPRTWIARGVVERLAHGRFWAKQQATEPDPALFPLAMDGTDASIDDLVRDCRRGLLVQNLWYIRFVDPRTLTLTGLTRDGVFLVEDGRIVRPVKNFRWNESPIDVLQKLTGLSRAERVRSGRFVSKVPAIASRDFTFTSTTDSV